MPRDAGLVDTSLLDDVIHLPLADEQRLDDTAASRVGESLEGIYMHACAYAYRRMPAPSSTMRQQMSMRLELEKGLPAQIDVLATRLLEGHKRRHAGAAAELHNWLPGATQQSPTAPFGLPLNLDDAREAAARAHGFADRHAAASAAAGGDPEFEAAIEALLQGDVARLTAAIDRTPDLVVRRSHYGHGATLLHYLSANGVETYRQHVPLNGATIASMLLARGADPNAEADMYGGRRRTRGMLISSAHPRLAGVTDEILRVLDRAGAA